MPHIQVAPKFKPVLTTKKRFVGVVGGRGSSKSEGMGRNCIMRAQTEAADVLCGREYQNSIEDSVHKLIKGLIHTLGVGGASIGDKKIDFSTGGGFRFKGFHRNPENVKSAQDFKYSWLEEAQALSEQSIEDLLPTIRAQGSQLFFTANPGSSEDPFSQRFIVPWEDQLRTQGYYEDDLHLIILMNYMDNPFFPEELEQQRQWDYENMSRAKYDHIWLGAFNDSVDDALIQAEWFDACIDAHKKLGFQPTGAKIAAHDPSDGQQDSKGYAMRHGSVLTSLQEKMSGNVNEGGDWATGLAIQEGVHNFSWDADGMGVALARQISQAFDGIQCNVEMFKGSQAADYPDALYEPTAGSGIKGNKSNKDTFKNQRAQYYFMLRDRVYRTYRAVTFGEYSDPDKLISFSSDIELLPKLRAELCRLPTKPNGNGKLELYTKPEMLSKFKIKSPNLADSVMMTMRRVEQAKKQVRRPRPIRPMGR